MSDYTPPLSDMAFLLHHVFSLTHPDLDPDTTEAILDEAGKLAKDVLAPLNVTGDQHGATFDPATGAVTTAPGFQQAYHAYAQGGWNAVPFSAEYGGQALPWALAFALQEMWQSANMSFGLCPLLNQGAIEAIAAHGSSALKAAYLEKLISGEWTGTMNLTEPQAGSDLGLLAAKAEPAPDGSAYHISGQKIYITYGEHDLADNIIHLVLARLKDAPDDVRGISLFAVPKILQGARDNAVRCIGLEHKLGIHASPTCTMEFDGAIGYLVGEPHQGLACMFTMMNNARLSVGLQGVAIAERAYQKAQAYAHERVQGKLASTGKRGPIAQHPDVQRMLMTMRAMIAAGRALAYQAAFAVDAQDRSVDVLTPLVKSWCTDMANKVASLGVQIHGGMGFIEETGAAQYLRDARILPIYEGTNGIQAADLMFRKVIKDKGRGACQYVDTLEADIHPDDLATLQPHFTQLRQTVALLVKAGPDAQDALAFAADPFLQAFALTAGAALLSRVRKAAANQETPFQTDKDQVCAFFVDHLLPHAQAYLSSVQRSL